MGLRLWKSECPVCAQGRAVLCPGHTKRGLAKRGTIGSQATGCSGCSSPGQRLWQIQPGGPDSQGPRAWAPRWVGQAVVGTGV